MSVDYDGVIIGGTVQARAVAAVAARQGARVALAESPGKVERQMRRQLTVQLLVQESSIRQQQAGLGLPPTATVDDWLTLKQQLAAAIDIAYPHLGLDTLTIDGVDVLLETGQLSPKPRLAFTTESRYLRGRSYLLSPPTQVIVPAIPGLGSAPLLTPEVLLNLPEPPPELVILGRSPDAIALAQALAMLGVQVTLVTRGDQLLPTEDRDISRFVESLLLAAGVHLQLQAHIASIRHKGHFTVHLIDGQQLETPQLLLATTHHPELMPLNLLRLGLATHPTHIAVDDQLKTTRPGCFAFGPCLGGYWANHIDHQDGPMALHNALYLPWRRIQRFNRVSWIATLPEFARFGMTARQAIAAYGNDAQVIQVSCEQVFRTHLDSRITGFCRCIIHRDGQVLGAQIIGSGAVDLSQTLALLVQNRIGIHQMVKASYLPITHTELLHRLGEAWQKNQWQPGHWRRDWAENWFNWRRSRHRN